MQQQYGMLGPMPWEIEQRQQMLGRTQDMQAAQLTPDQLGVFSAAQGGRALGGALNQLGGAMGLPVGQNPAMAQAAKMQAINKEIQASGISPADTENYLTALGEKLAAAGMVDEALNVGKALQAHKDKQADLDIKGYNAETGRLKAEAYRTSKLKSDVSQEVFKKNKEYTPASLQAYLESITDATPNGNLSVLKPFQEPEGYKKLDNTSSGLFIFDNGKGQPVVRVEGELVPYNPQVHGVPMDKSTKVNIGLPSIKVENIDARPAEDVWGSQNAQVFGATRKKLLDTLGEEATAAKKNLPDVQMMRELAQTGNLITGSLKDQRLGLARIAATVAPSSGIAQKVNDSDFFDQFATEILLPKMKMLGGNDSNEELRTLQKAVANRTLTPQQIVRSINFMEDKMKRTIGGYNEYQQGLNSGRKDPLMFDPVNYRWPDAQMREDNQVGTTKQIVETKNAGAAPGPLGPPPANRAAPAYVTPQAPVVPVQAATPPIAPPVGNPKFEAAVGSLMTQQGLSREQAIAKLMAAKAAAQGR